MNFNKNNIVGDFIFHFNPFNIETFFIQINSPLTSKNIAKTIEDTARDINIDPRFILTKMQVEQSALTKPFNEERMNWIMGCGCLSNGNKKMEYKGFQNQIRIASEKFKGYIKEENPYYIGDKIGEKWVVSDGVVICENFATAALYRYTPWIGDKDLKKRKAPFGNYLFFNVWNKYFKEI